MFFFDTVFDRSQLTQLVDESEAASQHFMARLLVARP